MKLSLKNIRHENILLGSLMGMNVKEFGLHNEHNTNHGAFLTQDVFSLFSWANIK